MNVLIKRANRVGSVALLLASVYCLPVVAQANSEAPMSDGDRLYCAERGLGDYFYCRAPIVEDEKPAAREPIAPPPTPVDPPEMAELKAFQKRVEEYRTVAIMTPTQDNVRRYMLIQIEAADKAEKFAGVFRRLGWQEPELSYNYKDPVNRAGLQVFRTSVRMSKMKHMKSVSERYGIFYFFAGGCAACTTFSPVLSNFATMHGFKVVAISMDGAPNYQFDDVRPNEGIAEALGMSAGITPATVLFDAATQETIILSFGMIPMDELEDRVFELTNGQADGYLGDVQ